MYVYMDIVMNSFERGNVEMSVNSKRSGVALVAQSNAEWCLWCQTSAGGFSDVKAVRSDMQTEKKSI